MNHPVKDEARHWRQPKTINSKLKAFTLVELLIVIAILGILAAAIMVAINPGKRTKQARDAQRKSDINAIANALIGYFVITGNFPMERICDTSRGSHASFLLNCSSGVSSTDWGQTSSDLFYQEIVVN